MISTVEKMTNKENSQKTTSATVDFSRSMDVADYEKLDENFRKLFLVKRNIFPTLPYKKWKESGVSPAVGMIVKLFRQMLPDKPPQSFLDEYENKETAEKAWIGAIGQFNRMLTGRDTEANLVPMTLDDLMPHLFEIGRNWAQCRFGEEQSEQEHAQGLAIESMYPNNLKNQAVWLLAQVMTDTVGLKTFGEENNSVQDQDPTEKNKTMHERAVAFENAMKDWFGISEKEFFASKTSPEDKEKMWNTVSRAKAEFGAGMSILNPNSPVIIGKRRAENRHVTVDELAEEFGFKDVRLGSWLDETEKQKILDTVYDSFDQMSEALTMPRLAMGLNGTLTLALTSSALQGKKSQYDPETGVLNLAGIGNGGNLAEEWFKAFDQSKDHVSENCPEIRRALTTASVDPVTLSLAFAGELLDAVERFVQTPGLLDEAEQPKVKTELTNFIVRETVQAQERMMQSADLMTVDNTINKRLVLDGKFEDDIRWNTCTRREFLNLRNSFSVHCFELSRDASSKGILLGPQLLELAQKSVETAFVTAAKELRINLRVQEKSDFLRQAETMDATNGSKPFYSLPGEMFARAAAAFVETQLAAKNERNDYLVSRTMLISGAENSGMNPNLYPKKSEREAIVTVFKEELNAWRKDFVHLYRNPIVQAQKPRQHQEIPVGDSVDMLAAELLNNRKKMNAVRPEAEVAIQSRKLRRL